MVSWSLWMHPQVNVFLYSNYMYSVIDIPELFDQVLAFLIISLYMVDGYFFSRNLSAICETGQGCACMAIPTCIEQ